LGFERYIMCNVSPYRCTNPAHLPKDVDLNPAANVSTILSYARMAHYVVVAWGILPKSLRPAGEQLLSRLREAEIDLWCLGTNKDGSPKHPLYQPDNAPIKRFT